LSSLLIIEIKTADADRRRRVDNSEVSESTMNTSVTAESVPFLISLLKMDAVLDIEVAKAHAICHLESHPDLDLTTKLYLCHRFKIILWLSPTFKALVSQPIESLDPLGLGWILTHILHALI
jgi:hypothetical protein